METCSSVVFQRVLQIASRRGLFSTCIFETQNSSSTYLCCFVCLFSAISSTQNILSSMTVFFQWSIFKVSLIKLRLSQTSALLARNTAISAFLFSIVLDVVVLLSLKYHLVSNYEDSCDGIWLFPQRSYSCSFSVCFVSKIKSWSVVLIVLFPLIYIAAIRYCMLF